ncbi:MAG: hypothetical protein K0R63_982 [Rickettsiales bacterium]|jgi:hypothetical protein|nr:hypothetical protein [Rickettsiales bacterium]
MLVSVDAKYNVMRMKERVLFDSFLTLRYPALTDIETFYRVIQSDAAFSRYYYQHAQEETLPDAQPSYTLELHFPRLTPPRKGYAELIELCRKYGYSHEADQLTQLHDAFVTCKVKAQLNREKQGITLECDSDQTAAIILEELEHGRRYKAETGLLGLVTIHPRQHVKNSIDTLPEHTVFGRRWSSYDSLEDLISHLREMHYRHFREGTSIPAIVKLIAALYRLEKALEQDEIGRVEEE